jgi:glutaredoxin
MNPTHQSSTIKSIAACALLISATALISPQLQAQQVFRIVGPDGKVTFSDKPPVETNAKVTTGTGSNAAGAGSGSATLPFELRQVAQKYPVTLYTGDNCGPCQSARTLLLSRGIPFVEKTVNTNDDALALQRLSGDSSLPFATIGGQQLKGFSDSEWTQFLNAAAYPSTSLLPANYKQPPATPMVAVSAAPANAPARAAAAPAAAPTPAAQAAPAPANPAGIRF